MKAVVTPSHLPPPSSSLLQIGRRRTTTPLFDSIGATRKFEEMLLSSSEVMNMVEEAWHVVMEEGE